MNNEIKIQWTIKNFEELSTTELYALLRTRQEVFVVEQRCAYLDADSKDLAGFHLIGKSNEQIAAYARLLPPGVSYKEASLGRVLVTEDYRKSGIGRVLLEECIRQASKLFPGNGLRISAQAHLKKFYESGGFVKVSEQYLEDDIPHIEMVRNASATL